MAGFCASLLMGISLFAMEEVGADKKVQEEKNDDSSAAGEVAEGPTPGLLSWLTTKFSDSWHGVDKNVVQEIENNNFDATDPASLQRLEQAFVATKDSPEATIAIISACVAKKITLPTHLTHITNAKQLLENTRAAQESAYKKEIEDSIAANREKSNAIVSNVKAVLEAAINDLKALDEKTKKQLSEIESKHFAEIKKFTDAKDATNTINSEVVNLVASMRVTEFDNQYLRNKKQTAESIDTIEVEITHNIHAITEATKTFNDEMEKALFPFDNIDNQ